MNKLLCHWGYAKSYDENRRASKNKIKSDIVEQWRRYHWLRKLGGNHNLTRQASYMKDHNQFVMTETCIVRALSKQRLTNNGLVSCLDYYLIRHKRKFN